MVFTLPATIAIPLLPFPFQPFASRWFLVLLFFFFLLVPKSLLCCSRCFGPVLVYVQSSSIYAASLLFSQVSYLLFLSSSSSVLAWSCHWICRILRRHLLSNTSTALSSPLFIFHVSHPYSRTGTTSVLYSLSFVLLRVVFERQILFNLTNALLAFESLFFGCFIPAPPSLQTVAPK